MTNTAHTPQDWYVRRCPETERRFLCQTGHDDNIAELFGTQEQNALIAAAPELLVVARVALDYLDGDEYLQACAILARAQNETDDAPPIDERRKEKTAERRTYHVVYAITREETYEIEAADAVEAEQDAFSDGKFVHTEETTNVECCEIRQIGARRRVHLSAVRASKGGAQ